MTSHPGFITDPLEIKAWLDTYCTRQHSTITITEDGKVNVDGSIRLKADVEYICVEFNRVKGIFNCTGTQIRSLRGAPATCNAITLYCCNALKSLIGGPKVVTGGYGIFYCDNIVTLDGAPEQVRMFIVRDCANLTSLTGLTTKGHSLKINIGAISEWPDAALAFQEIVISPWTEPTVGQMRSYLIRGCKLATELCRIPDWLFEWQQLDQTDVLGIAALFELKYGEPLFDTVANTKEPADLNILML